MKTHLLSARSRTRAGFTYLTIVISMIVVGLMLAAYLKLVGVQNQLTSRSQTWNRAVPVLEAGLEEAMAHLNKNGSPDASGTVNLASLATEGWFTSGGLNGPWYRYGFIDQDFYFVEIGSWDGSTARFPSVNATGWVQQLPAFAQLKRAGLMLADSVNVDFGTFTKRVVRCTITNNPTFSRALVAKHGIDLNGQNVFTDSYDSGNAAYSTLGRWDVTKRRDHGDVASNDSLTNVINVGNANIWGHVATGPGGTVTLGPNGAVGDAAWQNGGNHGIKPGFSTDDMNVDFPDVTLPATSGGWLPIPGNRILTTGDYRTSSQISGSLTVATNATVRLRVDGGWRFTGQDTLTINSNSTIKIYLNCASADITGNGIVNTTGKPYQCLILGTPLLTSLDMGGNGESTCAVYAPSANVTLHGGGNSDQDFSGALIANTFTFSGHYTVHYDEALGRNGLWRGFTITSWDER